MGTLSSWPGPPLGWTGHASTVLSVGCSPNGTRVVTGSQDKTIRIWDVESGSVVGEPLTGHTSSVDSVAYSPDGRRIISGSYDRTIRIWDAETGALVGNPLYGHTDSVRSVACASNGRHIISGSNDSTIRIWDFEANTEAGKPNETNTYPVQSVNYSSDGQNTASGPYDGTTHVWDALPYVSIRPLPCTLMHAGFYAKPDMDGWVRSSTRGLLYWVPHDCRPGLHSPALLTIPLTSRNRSLTLDFNNFVFGTSWTQIFKSARS